MRARGGRNRQTSSPRRRLLRRWRVVLAFATVAVVLGAVGIAAAAPEYVVPPEIASYNGGAAPAHPKPGERLVCGSGTWRNQPSFEYEWIREGVRVKGPLPGGEFEGSTYTLTKADENQELWCVVIARDSTGETKAESVNGICVGECHKPPPEPPKSVEPPKITPTSAVVGKALTCNKGTWTGSGITYTFIWLRDKAEAIKGATGETYTVVAEDETHSLSCRVTASNAGGEASAESSNSVFVSGTPPENTELPRISGVARINETLTCSQGTWRGSPPIKFVFQWLRDGSEITAASGSTYTVQQADENHKIACKVTAENGAGKAVATSAAVTISGEPLQATGLPVITETPEKSGQLKCSEGSWNQPLTSIEYQWLRDREGVKEAIAGANTNEHTVVSQDVGHLLYCQVSARNSRGEQKFVTSEGFAIPKGPGVPVNKSVPTVEGSAAVNQTLTCREGEWVPTPSAYAFQWLRDGAGIPGASSAFYQVKTADEGHQLECKVVAENSEGPSEPAFSVRMYVPGEKPHVNVPPEVSPASSSGRVGETLTCVKGEWTGAPPPTFTYQWFREGVAIAGATKTVYEITQTDRGHWLTCAATASNREGTSSPAASRNKVYIPGSEPVPPLEGPTVSPEAPGVGQTATCVPGEWGGAPYPHFTYQWLLNKELIPGATSATFTVGPGDRGALLSCRVTGTNTEGSATSVSKAVHIAGIRPEPPPGEYPLVVGSGTVGSMLTCEPGEPLWRGKPPPSFTYQWYRDGALIAGAIEKTYLVRPEDQGHLLSCIVIATNIEGRAEAESINAIFVPTHSSGAKNEVQHFEEVHEVTASPLVILASLRRQLTTALESAHLRSVLKAHGFSFGFRPPADGTLEVLWYKRFKVRGAHGSNKTKSLVLGQASATYASIKQSTVRVKLTATGKSQLQGRKHVGLIVKAVFKVPHKSPVTWETPVVLS